MTGPQIRHVGIGMKSRSDISCGKSIKQGEREGLVRGVDSKSGIKQRGDNDAGDENDANLMGCAVAG